MQESEILNPYQNRPNEEALKLKRDQNIAAAINELLDEKEGVVDSLVSEECKTLNGLVSEYKKHKDDEKWGGLQNFYNRFLLLITRKIFEHHGISQRPAGPDEYGEKKAREEMYSEYPDDAIVDVLKRGRFKGLGDEEIAKILIEECE